MTTLASLLGTGLPLIQAPMAGVQDEALALAVARAGGLGSLPCALLDPARLEAALQETQSRLDATQKKLDAVIAIERNMRPKAN